MCIQVRFADEALVTDIKVVAFAALDLLGGFPLSLSSRLRVGQDPCPSLCIRPGEKSLRFPVVFPFVVLRTGSSSLSWYQVVPQTSQAEVEVTTGPFRVRITGTQSTARQLPEHGQSYRIGSRARSWSRTVQNANLRAASRALTNRRVTGMRAAVGIGREHRMPLWVSV